MEILGQENGENFTMYNGDCVEIMASIPDDSIHFMIYSPPFASLFTYSDSDRDMGNCASREEFIENFGYLTPNLYRTLIPGRLMAVHCMNLPATIGHDWFIGMKDFRGDLVRIFERAGFVFHSEIMIWKDPLVQATRTKTLTLAHKQISKDATRCSQGFPDYVVVMRKPGVNPEPVSKGRGFERYVGTMDEPRDIKTNNARTNKYSHKVWQRYASPVWFDIDQTNTLNAKMAREKEDERHCCPLQLQTIERCLELWTNEGDVVLSPFAGIGSEGYQSLKSGRKFIGIELKKSYYDQAVKYLRHVENAPKQLSLF